MSAHHHSRIQRRVIRGALVAAVVAVAVGLPMLLSPQLRLDVGLRLGLAPGDDAVRMYDGEAAVELIVLVEEVPQELTLPTKRYVAAFVAEQTGSSILVHDLEKNRDLTVPMSRYDFVSAAADRSAILFVDQQARSGTRAVLVVVETGEVRPLPDGSTDLGLPGNWQEDIAAAPFGCNGVSPRDTWVACILTRDGLARYVFGDWELRVHRYGNVDQEVGLLRGRGTTPIGGWSRDERWIYVQNETGIWRVKAPAPPGDSPS